MNIAQTFQQAEDFFFSRKYQEAADLCRNIIDVQPDYARAYYLLGALFKMTGNFEQAIAFSDMAIARDSGDAQFYLQKGHSLLSVGKIGEAESSLKQAIALNQHTPLAYVFLANIAMKKRDYTLAESYLAQAKALTNMPEIEEHLGLCAQMQKDFSRAEQHYRAAIALDNQFARGYLNLAKLLGSLKRMDEAEPFFREAIKGEPNAFEALVALAQIEERKGNFKAGAEYAQRAIQSNPNANAGYIVLGGILISSGLHVHALPTYEEGLKRFPDDIFLIEGYAKVLMQMGRLDEAKPYIEKVLAKKPDDKNMQYLYAAISGKPMDTAPPEYVAGLFNEYAERFEEHLTQALRYHTPDEISVAVREVLSAREEKSSNLSLLDLGCGTGLGAEALRDISGFRVGVDLSSKMIEKTHEKRELYAETAVQDITQYMCETEHRFDLVICVDTLVYIGNLAPFFAASKQVLKAKGLLAVSVEQAKNADTFELRPSARYGHAKSYLEACAADNGLACRHISLVDLRKDKEGIIRGYIAVFEKLSA